MTTILRRLPLALLLVSLLCAAAPAQDTAPIQLGFIVGNLRELESNMAGASAIQIRDNGSRYPGAANFEVRLYRIIPAIQYDARAGLDATKEMDLGEIREPRKLPGFEFTVDLSTLSHPLPPGLYRVQLSFFRGQKAGLEKALAALPAPVIASQTIYIGTKLETLAAVRDDFDNLLEIEAGLNAVAAALQADYEKFAQGPISLEDWFKFSQQNAERLAKAHASLLDLGIYGMMADACAKAGVCMDEYLQQQLGLITFNLGGPGHEEKVESMKDAAAMKQVLSPDLATLFMRAELARQTPFHLLYYMHDLQDALPQRYAAFVAAPDPQERAAFEKDWAAAFALCREILDRFEKQFSPDALRALQGRLASTPNRNWSDFNVLGVMRLNLRDFLDRCLAETGGAPQLLRDWVTDMEALQALLAKAADEGKALAEDNAAVAKLLKAQAERETALANILSIRRDYPQKQLDTASAGGIKSKDEEENENN